MQNGNKKILDAFCGSKMFWFNKTNPDVLFMDIRKEEHVLCDGRSLSIAPDVVADFRDMPFADNSFKMVVFDPPHIDNLGESSWMFKKYGKLLPTWEDDIRQGFVECLRVLEPQGVLIFKWNEQRITVKKVLALLPQVPLFGHPSGKSGKTKWLAFMKQ